MQFDGDYLIGNAINSYVDFELGRLAHLKYKVKISTLAVLNGKSPELDP